MPGLPTNDDLEQVATYGLAVLLVVAAAGVVYLAVTPGLPSEPYTEFYILGADGEARDYPTNLSVGEQGEVVVGIVNHERKPMTYTVVLALEESVLESTTVSLEQEETWENRFDFTIDDPGTWHLAVRLYQEEPTGDQEPYRSLSLEVTVTDSADRVFSRPSPAGTTDPHRYR